MSEEVKEQILNEAVERVLIMTRPIQNMLQDKVRKLESEIEALKSNLPQPDSSCD